jgi:hypothetical protein
LPASAAPSCSCSHGGAIGQIVILVTIKSDAVNIRHFLRPLLAQIGRGDDENTALPFGLFPRQEKLGPVNKEI